jgi:iron complex transport system ATP-binding protein
VVMISAQQVSFSVGQRKLVADINIEIIPGEFLVIMGANGAGKSTLLKMLAGSLAPTEGRIEIDGKNITSYKTETLALKRAVLSQHYEINFPSTAEDIVMMGRYPYFETRPSAKDEAIVTAAMEQMQVQQFRDRDYNTLSGGEAQKVHMSRVLSQIGETNEEENKILFLDEPVSHLDIKYQHQLLKVAGSLCKKQVTVVAILHDINLALTYADRILFMKDGAMVQELKNMELLSASILKKVFDVDSTILFDERISRPVVVF